MVITGLSGSGKSSLAFDTLYAEGQRRYVESLSTYARQFLGQLDKPDVDVIEGLSPAIAIEQKATSHNPRSTVGTVTEINDYLRLLLARAGVPHCPQHGQALQALTVSQMVDRLLQLPEGTRLMLLAPVVSGRKGEFAELLVQLQAQGFVRFRIDGQIAQAADLPTLDKTQRHAIAVVVDGLKVRPDIAQRLAESLEAALRLRAPKAGRIEVQDMDSGQLLTLVAALPARNAITPWAKLEPRLFSLNAPHELPHLQRPGARGRFRPAARVGAPGDQPGRAGPFLAGSGGTAPTLSCCRPWPGITAKTLMRPLPIGRRRRRTWCCGSGRGGHRLHLPARRATPKRAHPV